MKKRAIWRYSMRGKIFFITLLFLMVGCGVERVGGFTDGSIDGMDFLNEGVDVNYDSPADIIADNTVEPSFDFNLDGFGGETVDIVVDEMRDITADEITADIPAFVDSDGDTIRDEDEGGGMVDTDSDTMPDTMDTDSDGDGIDDSIEAGDSNPLSPPVDSDGDGTPDFRDDDSDGDTISDLYEGADDPDSDGIPNYRDFDSDGDFIPDSMEAGDSDVSTPPVDTDFDGTADYLDLDSDNDYISDMEESVEDTDGDSTLDYVDTDSDNDTLPDSQEAGDTDLSTPARDCGDDHLPNYRDTDSDNDGIGDAEEVSIGTDICSEDTDGDGVSDLIEVTYGSDPLNSGDSPRTHGDFVFVVPYMAPPEPTMDTLVFSTDIQQADVFFTIDTSGSMRGEINNLRNDLQTVIVPGIRSSIPDVQFGVGRFEDCPNDRYCRNAMKNLQDITNDIGAVQSALNSITSTCGGSEPYTSNLWVIATGNTSGWAAYAPTYFAPHPRRCSDPATIGWPCFRPGAVPIIIQFGDEPFSEDNRCSPHKTTREAIAALNSIRAKYIGVNSGSSRADMVVVASGTGSVDIGGTPLVFDINPDGSGLGSQVVDAVAILANQVPIEVSAVPEDDPADAVDATIFILRIEPNTVGGVSDPTDPTKVCVGGLPVEDRSGDGHPDVFTRVLPGTTVCFDIYPQMNTTVAPEAEPRIFRAFINVLGDGITLLDSRDVYFLVPPEIPGGN